MSDLQRLHQLQEIDLRCESLQRELQEIDAVLADESELASARAAVARLRDHLREQEQRSRELEWSISEVSSRIQQDEQRLYSGTIRNPKELEGLQRELEQRKAQRSRLEDQELELLDAIEKTQADLAAAEAELNRIATAVAERNQELLSRRASVQGQLDEAIGERGRLSAQVAPSALAQYEQLRRAKRGLAVSRIERATCQGCRIALPLGLVQRVRAGRDLIFCPSCGRILYAP
ncbi:MAG: hypothetical protein IRY83_14955 [Chloroflexi bacterium]|nr:hypothetical protein [Chloroflexota bacterium]